MQMQSNNRGFAMILSCSVLALLFTYSYTLVLGTLTQVQAANRLRERNQAMDLAQAAAEQLRQELYVFLTVTVYQNRYKSDAVKALAWLDKIGTANYPSGSEKDGIKFDLPTVDSSGDFQLTELDNTDGVADGTALNPRALLKGPGPDLRYGTADDENLPNYVAASPPRAWLVSVVNPSNPLDSLATRDVTIEAVATVGSTTQRFRAHYQAGLGGVADVFRYGYFLDNYRFLDSQLPGWINIFGEARTNGDMDTISWQWQFAITGDLFAAKNPDVINLRTGLPSDGLIVGNPANETVDTLWGWKPQQSRPNRNLVMAGQPPIGGIPKVLPYGEGWDSSGSNSAFGRPDQTRYERQDTLPMPYVGDLSYYKNRAALKNSSLTYNQPGTDGLYGTADDVPTVISQVYNGPDGSAGTADDKQPLVLYGTPTKPIVLNGPVVIQGDVIIRGTVSGRGTVFSGRNVHITGEVLYKKPSTWPAVERLESNNPATNGQLRPRSSDGGAVAYNTQNLGYVCSNGTYRLPAAGGCNEEPACVAAGNCAWKPYAFVVPGDPVYGFPAVKASNGIDPLFPDPKTTDFLALSAQGNVVIGDYTDKKNADGTDNPFDFPGRVVPKLSVHPGSPLQAYAIDPADAPLGYHDAGFVNGMPKFSGDYTQVDMLGTGVKTDGSPRHFYESSLSDAAFVQLVDPRLYDRQTGNSRMNIDAVLFARHLVTGFTNTGVLFFNGGVFAHDETFDIGQDTIYKISSDTRLLNGSASDLDLPASIGRLRLTRWEQCPPAACP